MNYYYNNYPTMGYQPQYNTMQSPSYQGPQAPPALNGKMVDSIEMVKVSDVPFGSFGIFPKADLSEIYIKSWNSNGTTTTATFKPVAPIQQSQSTEEILLQKIAELDQKISKLMLNNNEQKKEVITNDTVF